MHQNKFHTETIQQLTKKYETFTKGGPPLTAEERKTADHLKILYKFANKGIKGRGKKEKAAPKSQQQQQQQTSNHTQPAEQNGSSATDTRPFPEQTLLPLPFLGLPHWSRGEDVFVNQSHAGQVQSNAFLGIPGDGTTSGGLAGYTFGNLG